ncbi:helix-turn-helix domain-containing protein [Aliarcobacter butzleri]|uniref:helix-turn-helix domain-containing protein n=1 Tax=Aliarcobacter butzleri TaxID=28197 RepID=UPI0021B2C6A8|nr:helix-turn-helix transcriptional regulator [Aliarcobacter butzleri]MCT7610172.1 helix-turn-helix domain-containing protein [Aliarcobacter butzleri]
MINSLNEKIKNKRLSLNLKQIDIQNLSYDYFGENEVINIDYIQKVESGKFKNLELWTLYKLSSILNADIFFSNPNKKIEIDIFNTKYIIDYKSLLSIDPNYTMNHRGIEYKKQFFYLISDYIKNSRNEFKLTQNEFSRFCSISRVTLQRLENGSVSPKLNTLLNVLFSIYKLRKGI